VSAEVQTPEGSPDADPAEMKMLMDIFGGTSDPSPAFAKLRESRPVAHIPELGMWVVSRYDDCITVLRDLENFTAMPSDMMSEVPESLREKLPDGYPAWYPGLVNTEPPAHTRIRKLAQKPITPRKVSPREEMVRDAANRLVDAFVDDGRVDLVSAYAMPLPITVLRRILGVPEEDERKFADWVKHATELFNPAIPEERRLNLAEEQVEFGDYVSRAIRDRRENPGDDLISEMLAAEAAGERKLSDKEVHGVVSHIILGGFDSTAGAICFALSHVCSTSGLAARVMDDPGLLPLVVEETIRRSTPVRGVVREAKNDVELGGEAIPAGSRVMALVRSANQDPAQFTCPHEFDIDRDPTELRRHIGFGQGIHKCIGQPIAQLEIRISLEILLNRLPNLRVVTEEVSLSPGIIFVRPSELEFAWDTP
jgi:cytochrome P450